MCMNMGGIETGSLSDGNVLLGMGGMLVSSVLLSFSTKSYENVR